MTFNFPRTRYADTNDMLSQVAHLMSEGSEVLEAMVDGHGVERVAEEVMDLMHSAETMLRIMAERHGVNLDEVRAALEAKNARRGYYEP